MPFKTISAKTIEYLGIPCVVGHEGHFMRYLEDDFKKLELTIERQDQVIVISGSKPLSSIISAHLDRHGLISIEDDQYTYAAQHILEEKYDEENDQTKAILKAISKRFEDEHVYAYNPETGERLCEGKIESCEASMENGDSIFHLHNIAAMPKDIPIAYAREAEIEGNMLKGQIDNALSLGTIYTLFKNGFQGTALLTTEEEIGKSWIHMTDWLQENKVETQELIIIDTSPYRENGPINDGMITLRNRDKSAVFNADLVQKIKQRCEALNLIYQVKDEYFLSLGLEIKDLGSTELGRIVQNTDNRWSGATIQIPTLEYHTSFETTSQQCIESFYALLHDILVENSINA